MKHIPILTILCLFVRTVLAIDYHIDYEAGDDAKDGLTPATAFKHCPGDAATNGIAAAVKLQPGDVVRFKGGVSYRGSVMVTASGSPGKPILFDGNSEGVWGTGRALIDGGQPITGWKACASAAEAKGNPRWAEIFYVDVPKPKSYDSLNLCDTKTSLPIAQHPNPDEFFWQEDKTRYLASPSVLVPVGGLKIAPEKGTKENKDQPINNLLTGNLAVISPVPGAGFTYTLEKASEIVALGIAAQPKYGQIKDIVVLGDDKELAKLSLEKDQAGKLQRFELPAPATVTRITFRFLSLHEGEKSDWSKLKQVAAFNRSGENLLKGADTMTFTDPEHLNQRESDWYDGMTFAFHAGNNHIFYLPIKSYDPVTHTLSLPAFGDKQYGQTAYCLFNSVRLIDQPGEYSVESTSDPKTSRVYLLPPQVHDGQPVDIASSASPQGFALQSASHIVVQGFVVSRQNGSALSAKGPASGIVFRDCEATLVRGTAVSANQIDDILLERLHVHDNPGHTKGIVLHTCTKATTRECLMVRNTSTAIDYYVCSDGHVVGNTVLENKGSHANGLTFYVGCKNILVERNLVAKGNCALTFQEGENFVFRNNVFDGNGESTVVGIWPSQPLRNVQIINNTIVRGSAGSEWSVGLFSNSRKIEGLVVKNNIIDGLFSDYDVFKSGTFSNNLYTRTAKDQAQGLFGSEEILETDLKKIFADPDKGDFHLRAGSPAIGAGADVGVTEDFTGKPRPAGRIDVGAFAFH